MGLGGSSGGRLGSGKGLECERELGISEGFRGLGGGREESLGGDLV